MIISLSRETCRVYSDRKNSRSKRESKHEFPEEPRGIRVRGTKKVRRKGKLSKKGNQLEVVVFVPHSSFEYLRGPILEWPRGEYHQGFSVCFPFYGSPSFGNYHELLFLVYHNVFPAAPFSAITPMLIENAR